MLLFLLSFLLPLTAAAAEFVPLVGIPGITGSPDQNLSEYVNALYRLMISIGALMAVVKIVGAGAKYMLSDVVTDKGSAKRDIKGAIFGLLIVIGAVVILNTINADIVNTSLTFRDTTLEPLPPEELTAAEAAVRAICTPARGSACTVAGCTIGILESCRSWCEDTMNGFVFNSGIAYLNCIVKEPISIPCQEQVDADGNPIIDSESGNPVYDCNTAEIECESLNGTPRNYINSILCEGWDHTLATP
jgi:hypothetical protein